MEVKRLDAIDGLRAVAVLAVVAHHAGLIPFAYGTRGVDLFFVISGFCLALPTLRKAAAGEPFAFDVRHFAIGRVRRIVPPYYVALAMFCLLSLTSFGTPSVLVKPAPFEWLSDALFFTGATPAYNASFWTLGVEARWYVCFPFVLALYMRSKRSFAVLGAAAYAVYAWLAVPADVGTLPCFMLGIAAADIYVQGRSGTYWFVAAAALSLGAALALDRGENQGDPIWHVASFFIVLAGVGALSKALSWRPLAAIGVASYSIYLVHQPVLLWLPHLRLFHAWAPYAVLSVVAGFIFWRLVEVPALAWTSPKVRPKTAVLACP